MAGRPGAPAAAALALTMGEPSGIGGEITLKAWLRRQPDGVPPFFIIDDAGRLERLAEDLDLEVPIELVEEPEQAVPTFARALPVMPLGLPVDAVPGAPDAANARAVIASIDRAAALALEGRVAGLVTNPVHKRTLYEIGFAHPGHTEYLAELAGGGPAVMMLTCPGLRTVPVTVHMALREALAALSAEAVEACAMTTAAALEDDFGIARPRLAVSGLNPHAGEDGDLGAEELEIIGPAVAALRRRGLDVIGPIAADSLFHAAARERYDAAVCMYHDQALIPIKTIDFAHGVNVTLGLALVRTSPDHGTALALAGTGRADEQSLIAALGSAAAIARHRAAATRPARRA